VDEGPPWQPSANQLERAERSKALLRQRQAPIYQGPLFVKDDAEVQLRTPQEAARRALVLWAVALRGEGAAQEVVRDILARAGVLDALTPKEQTFLDRPSPSVQEADDHVWRLECVEVLLWALRHVDALSWPTECCNVPRLTAIMQDAENDPAFVQRARLRPPGEVLDAQDLTLRLHWAIRQTWIDQKPIPADLDWSGNAERIPLRDCPGVGVVEQRHHALNWLTCFGNADWDDVDTPT
jgi:hypothetical protein